MKKIALISSFCDNTEKLDLLKKNIQKIKSLGVDVMVISPLKLDDEMIEICDFLIYTKENPLLYKSEFAKLSGYKYEDFSNMLKKFINDRTSNKKYHWAVNPEEYAEFMDGVSEETKAKYFIIPTKKRDKEGNRVFYKVAKEHFLMPYFSLTEGIYENRIRKENNMKEIPFDVIQGRMIKGIIENFGMKQSSTNIPFVSQAEMVFGKVKDVPIFKAAVSGYAGYDLYRNKPFDKYAKATYLEGMNNPNVEQFYKNLGADFQVSPIRMKNVVESYLTSPQSSPYLASSYEVLDYALTDKTMDNFGKSAKKVLFKGLELRTQGKSTEWMKTQNQLSQNEKENDKIKLDEYLLRQEFKDLAEQVIAGEVSQAEANQFIKQYEDSPNIKGYVSSYKTIIRNNEINKGVPMIIQQIKKESSPGARANMIKNIWGDIYSEDNKDVLKKLQNAKVINAATERYLKQKDVAE
jgi:hypothetical protein